MWRSSELKGPQVRYLFVDVTFSKLPRVSNGVTDEPMGPQPVRSSQQSKEARDANK